MNTSLVSNLWWDPIGHRVSWNCSHRAVAWSFGEGLRGVASLPDWSGVVVVYRGRGVVYNADGSTRTEIKLPMPNSLCNMIIGVAPEVLVVFDSSGLSWWGRLNADTGEVEDQNEWR